jgi:hypothetical protein
MSKEEEFAERLAKTMAKWHSDLAVRSEIENSVAAAMSSRVRRSELTHSYASKRLQLPECWLPSEE